MWSSIRINFKFCGKDKEIQFFLFFFGRNTYNLIIETCVCDSDIVTNTLDKHVEKKYALITISPLSLG